MPDVEVAVQYALSQVGKRYVWGTPLRSPRQPKVIQSNSYDCSGLTWAAFRAAGIAIGTVTLTQIRNGVAVSRGELKRGDLVFPDPGHVQIYLGNGTVVHSPNSRTVVRIDPLSRRFYAARRVVASGQSSSGAFVPVTGVRDTVGGFTNAINTLTDENTWRRGFMVFLGVLLLLPVLIQLRKTVGYA